MLGTHVSVVGVGHLTGSVDNAAHHSDLEVPEVGEVLLHQCHGGLQVEECPSATWAGDELGLAGTHAGRLQQAKGIVIQSVMAMLPRC